MSDEKIKVECRLITRGTDRADVQATDDLKIPDPELAVGKRIIEEEEKDENRSEDS